MAFSKEFITEVIDKSDIVTVISNFIDAQKKGSVYVSVCPFHNDTNPSMMISPTKKIFKCFSCGHGGNCISFVKDYLKISFSDALLKVCEICNIPVPKEYAVTKAADPNQILLDIVSKMEIYYSFQLKLATGQNAYKYLIEKRHLTKDVIDHFMIGYAPINRENILKVLIDKQNFPITDILKTNSFTSTQNGKILDKFCNRIIFPIKDTRGRVVGFSGRTFEENSTESKYLNSSESAIFRKGEILYHFDEAYQKAKQTNTIYIVEGFMDCIAMYRAGITNCVALMGTAFSEFHKKKLLSISQNLEVKIMLDNDSAGRIGTTSLLNLLANTSLLTFVIDPFTDVKDADEFISKHGAEKLKNYVETNYKNSYLYLLETHLRENGRSTQALSDFISKNAFHFNTLNDFDKERVYERLQGELKLSRDSLENIFVNAIKKRIENRNTTSIVAPITIRRDLPLQKRLITFTEKCIAAQLDNKSEFEKRSAQKSRGKKRNYKQEGALLSLLTFSNKLLIDVKKEENFTFNIFYFNIIAKYLYEYVLTEMAVDYGNENKGLLENDTAAFKISTNFNYDIEAIKSKNPDEKSYFDLLTVDSEELVNLFINDFLSIDVKKADPSSKSSQEYLCVINLAFDQINDICNTSYDSTDYNTVLNAMNDSNFPKHYIQTVNALNEDIAVLIRKYSA